MSDDYKRLIDQLFPCDTDDLEAAIAQHHVALTVALKGRSMTVKRETVDLHYETCFWPEKIDLEPFDAGVCFRLRETGGSDQT
jgi:hypothetical protein